MAPPVASIGFSSKAERGCFKVSADAAKPVSVSARLGVIAHRSEWPDSTQSKFKTQAEVSFFRGRALREGSEVIQT